MKKNYPDPLSFNPSRFLTSDGQWNASVRDPSEVVFGFGRRFDFVHMHETPLMCGVYSRICPGRHFAYDSVWITIASILSVFNITKVMDEKNGVRTGVSGEYSSGIVW